MYLFSVKIKNFRGYGENIDREDKCFLFDDLDVPLVVFKGYNGFGKTSFYEAIEWCLTDRVYRLEKLYDNKTYQAQELRRSHYLKFYHPVQGNSPDRDREVYVELTFSNGFRIVRKTSSNVLRTTERDSYYQSTLLMGDKDLKSTTNEDMLHKFIYNSSDPEAFFRTHMLGQENINDFLRHNSPTQRREIFMQLLQESKLNELLTQIKPHTYSTSKLKKSLRECKDMKNKYEENQEEISKFIMNFHFENIVLYLEAVEQSFLDIKTLTEQNSVAMLLNLEDFNNIKGINLNNINSFFEKLIFINDKINTISNDLQSEKEILLRNKKETRKLLLLNKTQKILFKSMHATKLLKTNFNDLQKKNEKLIGKICEYREKKDSTENELNNLFSYKKLFMSLSQKTNLEIPDDYNHLWDNIKIDEIKYSEFYSHYYPLIKKLKHSSKIKIDIDKYNSSRINFRKSLEEKGVLESKLAEIQSLKSETSTLNEQYQLALSSVKRLISSNSEQVIECPICLNDDFSNTKYSDIILKKPDHEMSISSKILTIIDFIFAAGNEKIDILGGKENDIQRKIEKIKKEIKKNLTEIFDDLRETRNLFEQQYNELEEHLKSEFQAYKESLERKEEEQNLISQQIKEIKESRISLFGDNSTSKDISDLELKHINLEKDRWITKSKDELGFLNGNINLTSIDTEISLLKDNGIEKYSEIDLSESIQKTVGNIEYLNNLSKKIKELIKYKVPSEYEAALANYNQLETNINKLSSKVETIEKFVEKVEESYTTLFDRQKQVIEERLENHPIVSWVYETINPHPFYKKLHIKNTNRGTNFLGQTQLDADNDLYLDQMFSAAQLNILALSIFLGLGLTQEYSNLKQIFLDDPIQSLDDVNILAFIDVLRAIMDSKYNDKHIIISTHNEDFAQLLAIKMRNRKVTQYSIEGYTEEGPKIKKI